MPVRMNSNLLLHLASRYGSHEDEFWLSILEKAYAKFHGCYYRLTSGVTSHAMIDLTGDVSETLYVLHAV